MADKKTELMAQFYAECQKKGYTDMTDSVQSLKAKVIATDLKLTYGNIASFYEKARICSNQVQRETAEARKQQEFQQQKEAQERTKRQVDGELLVTLSDKAYESEKAILVRVYIRPDKSVYYTINNGNKEEGTPGINIKEGGVVLLTYHPSKAVYTGATVGGITTGGIHYTQSGYTAQKTKSGKGDIEIVTNSQTFILATIKLTTHTCNLFKRDTLFKDLVQNKEIRCYVQSDLADAYYSAVKAPGQNYQAITYALTAAADAQRLSYTDCERITNILGRIIHGQFPLSDEQLYEKANKLSCSSEALDLKQAIDIYVSMPDYKDSDRLSRVVKEKYDDILQIEKEQAILYKEKRKKKNLIITAIALCAVIIIACIIPTVRNKTEENKRVATEMAEESAREGITNALIGTSWKCTETELRNGTTFTHEYIFTFVDEKTVERVYVGSDEVHTWQWELNI